MQGILRTGGVYSRETFGEQVACRVRKYLANRWRVESGNILRTGSVYNQEIGRTKVVGSD